MTDDQISYHSKRMSRNWSLPRRPGGSLGAFQRGLAGSGQVTLRHAQSTTSLSLTSLERALFHAMDKVEEPGLLSDEELMTLRYYVSEYNLGNVSVDALVLSLSQLLRSQTKLSLLSAVRKCVFNRDLDRFDVLVLRREVEASKKEHEIEKSTIHEVDENHKNDTNLHKRDCDRQHSRKNSALKSRSSSVPPIRSTMLNATVEEHLYLENTSYNNSGDAHLSPPNASSTPNDSGEQATRERLPPPPPVPAAVPTPQGGRRNQLKKTISPILKDDVELMTSSMKLVRPIKPKRSTLGKSYQEESRTNVSSWNPIYTETNESPMNMNMPNSSFTPNMIQYTSSSKNSTGSIGRLYPRKHEDAKVSFGSPPAQLDDADKHVRKTPSPFTKAIEKQSTLTKIKASKGNSHISLSGLDFFEAPQRNVAHLHMSSKRDHQTSKDLPKPTHSAPICVHRVHNNIHIMETLDSTNDSADDRPLPPPPMSLLRDQGPSSPPSHYPVKVDVHQASCFHGAPGYMDLPSDFKSTKISINVAPPTTSSDPSSIYTAVYNTNNSNRRSFSQEIDSDEYDQGIEYDDIINPYEYLKDAEKQKVIIFKVASTLGLSIEGGANTRQPLPRISSVQPGGCAHICGRLVSGHVVHQVNGIDMAGLEHPQITRTIASAFQSKDRDSLELLVSGPYRSKGNQ